LLELVSFVDLWGFSSLQNYLQQRSANSQRLDRNRCGNQVDLQDERLPHIEKNQQGEGTGGFQKRQDHYLERMPAWSMGRLTVSPDQKSIVFRRVEDDGMIDNFR